MRPFILIAMMTLASPVQVAAQTVPTMPPSTFPEAGTFCGFLTLCPDAAKPKAGG